MGSEPDDGMEDDVEVTSEGLRERAVSIDDARAGNVRLVSTEEKARLCPCGEDGGKVGKCPGCQRRDYDNFNAARSHPNSARFHGLLRELGNLHDRKQADYGRDDDPFANVRGSEEWGVPGWVGAMVRASDKMRRLQSLIRNGKLENESAEDSLRDLAVYTVIALVLFEQRD